MGNQSSNARKTGWVIATFMMLAMQSHAQPRALPRVEQSTPMAVTYFYGLPPCACKVNKAPVRDDRLERSAQEVMKIEFPKQLRSRALIWQTSVFGLPEPSPEMRLYKVSKPCLVLSEAKKGMVVRWKVVVPKTKYDDIKLAEEVSAAMRAFFGRRRR